jgi:hypothetical protein
MGCSHGIPPTCRCFSQSRKAPLSRPGRYQVDMYRHAFWPNKWNCHIYYLGDTVAGSCRSITAAHSSSASTADPLLLKRPPPVPPCPLTEFLGESFNQPEHAISLTCNDADFGKQENPLTASSPASMQDNFTGIIIKYFFHCLNSDSSILIGLAVLSADGLCPGFNACPNLNIFQHHFGIEFCHGGCSYIRAISPFKFAHCFGFID